MEVIGFTIDSVRRISSELRPTILDDLGLLEGIEWQAQQFEARTGIVTKIDSFVENIDLSREQATAIFRILQEALTNIIRHAKATIVNITIEKTGDEFVLEIRDNGKGITQTEQSDLRSFGLMSMRERAQLAGGSLDIVGVTQKGTALTLRVPIQGHAKLDRPPE
jgi:signal transduction histidine kinase